MATITLKVPDALLSDWQAYVEANVPEKTPKQALFDHIRRTVMLWVLGAYREQRAGEAREQVEADVEAERQRLIATYEE